MRLWKALLLRSVSSKAFAVMLIICALLPPLARACGMSSKQPAGGYVALAGDEGTLELCSALDDAGFESYTDVDDLRRAVATGEADCGAVINAGFGNALETGELEGVIDFISSPMSLTPELWRSHIGAAVFSLRAPYIAADSLEGTGIEREEVFDRYREMLSSGYLFSFDIEYAQGAVPQNYRARSFAVFAAGMSVFCTVMLPCCGEVTTDWRLMKRRVGKTAAFKGLLLPQTVLRAVLIWSCSLLGLVFCGMAGMALPLASYVLAVTVVATALHLAVRSGSVVWGIVVLMCASAPVICPVLLDLEILFPWIKIPRAFNMIYWLWPFTALVP